MSPRMRVRSAFVVLLGFVSISLVVRPSFAQGLIDYAPMVFAPDTVNGAEGVHLSFDVTAVDFNGEAITSFTASGSGVDAGAVFTVTSEQDSSGTLSWTPTFSQSGTYSVTFTASNAQSGSKTTIIQIADVPTIDLTTSGASVTDGQGVVWQESSGEPGGTGVFRPFLREQRDSVEIAFNTDYSPVPLDGKPGSWTHSLTFGSLATVSVGGVPYYSFRLDANELSGAPEELIGRRPSARSGIVSAEP